MLPGSFNFVLGLDAMSEMATVLGDTTAAARYDTAAERGRHIFHTVFWYPRLSAYGGDSGAVQTLTSPAIDIGAPPTALMPSVVKTLADDFSQKTNYTPQVGAVTSKIILNVLSENNLHSTALRAATTTQELVAVAECDHLLGGISWWRWYAEPHLPLRGNRPLDVETSGGSRSHQPGLCYLQNRDKG